MTCPTTKTKFPDEKSAWCGAINTYKKYHTEVFDVYQCECGSWHLTSCRDRRPYWVKREMEKKTKRQNKLSNESLKKTKRRKKRSKNTLTIAEQKEALKQINNKPKVSWWKRFIPTSLF